MLSHFKRNLWLWSHLFPSLQAGSAAGVIPLQPQENIELASQLKRLESSFSIFAEESNPNQLLAHLGRMAVEFHHLSSKVQKNEQRTSLLQVGSLMTGGQCPSGCLASNVNDLRRRTSGRVLGSSLGMIMWCCWCDSYNMKLETPPLWYVPLNIYHSLYTEYEHVLLLTVPFLLWYSDSLWAAQTGEQWAPKENGRRSSHQESRLGTSKVIYSSLFFSSSIVRLKHHPIRSCSKRVLYKDPYCLFIWAALIY